MTYYAPLKSRLVNGEKSVGEFRRYEYSYSSHANKIFLEKKPLCNESVMKLRHAQKELRCFSCALVEMVFYGLGLFDMMRAYAIVEDSKKIEPLAEFETGKMVACGPAEPAVGEVVFIDNKMLGLHRMASTDVFGVLDLEKILYDIPHPVNLKIYLESDRHLSFEYRYHGEQLFGYYEKKIITSKQTHSPNSAILMKGKIP